MHNHRIYHIPRNILKNVWYGNFTPGTLHTQGTISIEKINKGRNTIGKIFYRMDGHQLMCKSHSR